MALTVTEANAVNTVICYFTGQRDNRIERTETEWDEVAREGLAMLADKARKQLSAGFNGDDVRRAWSNVEACPWQVQPTTTTSRVPGQ